MKIAVCMSGQLRNWDMAKYNQKWFWGTSTEDVDYFIHTWNYSGDRRGVSQPYEWRDVSKKEFKGIVEWYDIKKSIYDIMDQKYFYGDDHWSSLFYSFAQSIMLKRQYEIDNDFEYDLVIKSRPDIVFDPKRHFSYEYLEDNHLHTTHGGNMEHEFGMFNINDICFYGNSYTMDMLVNLYFHRQKVINGNSGYNIEEGDLNFHPLGPGTLIQEYCRDYGITALPTFGKHGHWQETIVKLGCPENLDLLDVEEFIPMEEYFRKWYSK
jgi:hypothetical protein|tara:strand:+ start:1543 stop:2340 length:798 start_codon:yes stop_codon:yes gene_type:complete